MTLTWGERPPSPYQLRRLRLEDASQAYALSTAVGWSLSAAEWERLILWAGRMALCLHQEGRIVATGLATGYGRDRAWIGGVITHPDCQRQGLATQIMRALLDGLSQAGTRHVLLDASEQGRPLYEMLGFRPLYHMEIWSGRASSYLGSRARPLQRGDLAAVVALDARAFGVARGRVLRRLVQDTPEWAWVDDASGELTGFLLARERSGGAIQIGPWAASTPWSAETLLRTALSTLIGREVRVDIPERNTQGLIFAHNCDLRYRRHNMRMWYGRGEPPTEDGHLYYGAAALAIG